MLADKDLVSIQEVRSKVEKAYAAWQKYRGFNQEQVDSIVERMAAAARADAQRLAELAVEETGYGSAPDKLAKNLLCADLLPRRMRGLKTIGVLREIPEEKIVEIGVPVGVVAAILPTTNPTSTAIYKSLIALKAGNAIVLSPHPNAKNCTCETANILYQAAVGAGAREDIIQCINRPTRGAANALIRAQGQEGIFLHRRAETSAYKTTFDTELDGKSEVCRPAGAENRAYGWIRSPGRHADPGGGAEWSRQTASALGGKAFAGFVALFRE